jgi:hypothetical protein
MARPVSSMSLGHCHISFGVEDSFLARSKTVSPSMIGQLFLTVTKYLTRLQMTKRFIPLTLWEVRELVQLRSGEGLLSHLNHIMAEA